MTKQRAVGIKAIVRQKAIDSSSNIVSEVEHVGYFCLESFLGDILKSNYSYEYWDSVLVRRNSSAVYINCMDKTLTKGKFFEALSACCTLQPNESKLYNGKIFYMASSPKYDDFKTEAIDQQSAAFSGGVKSITGSVYNTLTSKLYNTSQNDETAVLIAHIRYLISRLSDADYNTLRNNWIDWIQKTMKKDFPELEGDVELVFDNEATIEAE